MLEIKMLKVVHDGEDEARKLLPHIQECDVFSQESQALTEEEAVLLEQNWEALLQMSRSRFRHELERTYGGSDSSFAQYNIKRDDYLFQNKKPIIFLERWSQEDSLRLKESENNWNKKRRIYLKALHEKEIDRFMELCPPSLRDFSQWMIVERDKHIADNLTRAEEIIHTNYPQLIAKTPKILTFDLGTGHALQRYTSIPIKVIDLDGKLSMCDRILHDLMQTEVPKDYPKRDLLAYGIGELAYEGLLSVDDSTLRNASFDELKKIVESN